MGKVSAMGQFFGAMLLGLGIVVAGLSGLCSLLLLAEPHSRDAESLEIVAVVGGIPFLIGIGLFFLGRRVLRGPARASQDVETFK